MRRTWLRRIGLAAAVILAVLVGIIAWQGMAPRYWALRLMLVRAGMWDWNWEWTLPGTRLSLRLESNDYWCIRCYRWIQRASIADQLLLAEDLLGDRRQQLLELATCLLEDRSLRSHPSPAIEATLLTLAGGTDWTANCAWSCLYRRSPGARPRLRELLLDRQLPVSSLQHRLPVLDPNDGQELVTLLALARRSDYAVRRRVLRCIGVMATPELLGTDAIQNLFRAEYHTVIGQPNHCAAKDTEFMQSVIWQRWLRLSRDELAALVEGDGPYGRSALEALIGSSFTERNTSIPSLVRDPTLPIFCRWQIALAAPDPRPLADDLAALADATLALPTDLRLQPLARLRERLESGEWMFNGSLMVPGIMFAPGSNPPPLLSVLGAETCARLGLPAPSTTAATNAP